MSQPNLRRDHDDPYAGTLPPLLVDRQRIVQSAAFRRLQHKTQVFVAPQSDHFRTRLTHTLEVAHQARCIALVLALDADLAEVVALAHDLGHPPFGHAGEAALNDCLREQGGFEHNRHTLRIVEELEHPYPAFHGLNLTRAVRECLAKHSTRFDRPGAHSLQDGAPPPPESLVVDLADRLTYALHDTLDGLFSGLLALDDLRTVPLWQAAYDGPPATDDCWRGHLRPAIDRIQQRVLDALREAGEPQLPREIDAELAALDQFLLARLYRSEPLRRADAHARQIVMLVFGALVRMPERLPERFRKRLTDDNLHAVVTDYVAGMTDRFCVDEAARLADAPAR